MKPEPSLYSFRFVFIWNEYPQAEADPIRLSDVPHTSVCGQSRPSFSWGTLPQISRVSPLPPPHQPGDLLRRPRHAHTRSLQRGRLLPRRAPAAAQWLISVDGISKFAILMALSAVGLNTSFANLRRIGFKPLVVGTIVAVALSVTSLVLILFTPLGG